MARRKRYQGQPTASAALAFTSDNIFTTITAATVFNGSGAAETLDAWLVPSGGSATDATKIYEGLSVADGETKGLQYLVGHTMEIGESLFLSASTTTTLTVRVSGDQHS